MYPLFASPVVAGLPITSLLAGTPDAMICMSAVCGHVPDDVCTRFAHVVYSLTPSAHARQRPVPGHAQSPLTVVELHVVL